MGPEILIVDDLDANLVALEASLRGLEVTLRSARSGDQALRLSLRHEFALAILDVHMPGMDGFELGEILRGEEATRELPIIYLTATLPADVHRNRGYQVGAVDYIVKPYDPDVLRSKVRVFLELERSRRRLARQKSVLEATNRELQDLTESLSQDLWGPLRSIQGFAECLREDHGASLPQEARDDLSRIEEAARGMGLRLDGLSELSRVASGPLEIEEIDFGALAGKVMAELRAEGPEREVEFHLGTLPRVRGDRALLRVVLEHLLGNALKFTGGRRPAHVSLVHEAGVFRLEDDGVGFPAEQAHRLFRPFGRLHPSRDFPGVGIGLVLVQRIIHRHGGMIRVEPRPGEGTRVLFELAIHRQSSEGKGRA